jgi:Glycosyl transferase family 8
MTRRGVIYCATAHIAYLEAALISALALRQQEPQVPITILSDQLWLKTLHLEQYGITPRLLTAAEAGLGPFSSRHIKTQLNTLTAYEESLFLDADILPLRSIADLWQALDHSDVAMVPDRLPRVSLCDHISSEEKEYTLARLAGDAVQFNSGVLLWRDTAASQSLFHQWHREWLTFQKQDQLALVRALHTTGMAVTPLPKTYNTSPIDAAPWLAAGQPVHLLHCWGGMVASGEYRQFAQSYHPQVVVTVTKLLERALPQRLELDPLAS